MTGLLRKPVHVWGKIHDITRENAGWGYVGFSTYRLRAGDAVGGATGTLEAMLVLIEGRAKLSACGTGFGEQGGRMDVFEKTKPTALYVPGDGEWSATATTDCTLAVCTAPAIKPYPVRLIGPDEIGSEIRGKGANTRHIHPLAMEDKDVASSLLVTEVFTPDGNWSSYPPHRHDEDDFPNMTYLEETYYHRINPASGFGIQRVFTEDGTLDETMAVYDHDVVLVPKGHHPCGSPYGFEMYYLNVMAGPLRKWRFKNHPDFDWLFERDR